MRMVPRPGYGLKSSTLPTRNGYVSTTLRNKNSLQQEDSFIFEDVVLICLKLFNS